METILEQHGNFLSFSNLQGKSLAWGERVGPAVLRHLRHHLTERSDVANGHKAAGALRKEARLHGEQRLEEACAYALAIRTFALKSLQSILREQPDKRPVLSAQPIPLPLTKTCGVPTGDCGPLQMLIELYQEPFVAGKSEAVGRRNYRFYMKP